MSHKASPSKLIRIACDFNAVDKFGNVIALYDGLLGRGTRVLLHDHDGNSCEALTDSHPKGRVYVFRLDDSTWTES